MTVEMTVTENVSRNIPSKLERPPKPKSINPIEVAVKSWISKLPRDLLGSIGLDLERLLPNIPKRWVVYAPMVLLPAGSFGSDWWNSLGQEIPPPELEKLWRLLLENIGKKEGKGVLTHLAVNSGIPLHKHSSEGSDKDCDSTMIQDAENILRTPSGLVMLYGDFGPSLLPDTRPSEKDFEEAFWVSTKQNGITQVWAPRYTMFSRGNVKEKARLLNFHKSDRIQGTEVLRDEDLRSATAIDLYAGIGYFVFSYVKMGMRKVVGWEINPWSVEGLRRGAVSNGWSVKVIKTGDVLNSCDEQIVVFLEDNMNAAKRLQETTILELGHVRHVNCGLLPTSEATWEMSLGIMTSHGWLHLHENVGMDDIQTRKSEIEGIFKEWLRRKMDRVTATVEHVELVKTFAPGVWHCVFDVQVMTIEDTISSA